MIRLILSIVGGLVVAFAAVFATDALFHALAPTAPAPATNDREAMRAYVAGQPAVVLAGLVIGWAVGVFLGSALAARFGGRGEWPGWVVGGLFLLATAANFLMVPHPAWMVFLAVVAITGAAWFGARFGAGASRRVPGWTGRA